MPLSHCHLQTYSVNDRTSEKQTKSSLSHRNYEPQPSALTHSLTMTMTMTDCKGHNVIPAHCRNKMMRFTSFPELSIAVVTHFGHPVFEVFQWVSVSRTGTAHHLHRDRMQRITNHRGTESSIIFLDLFVLLTSDLKREKQRQQQMQH